MKTNNPKIILWLIPDSNSEVFASYKDALCSLGHQVTLLNYRDEVLNFGVSQMKRNVLKMLLEPNVVDCVFVSFFLDSCEMSPEFLLEIKRKAPLILWSFDDEMYSTFQTIYLAQSADVVVTTDYLGRGVIDQIGVPTIYLPCPVFNSSAGHSDVSKSIDVSFIGNCNASDRSEFLEFLKVNGVQVKTFGHGSENGYVPRQTFYEIIRTTKVSLNFSKPDLPKDILRLEPWRQRVRQVKGRPFEIASVGGLCLTEYSPHIGTVFNIGEEIDVFWNKEDLLEKVKFYLHADDQREKMAQRAQTRVHQDWNTVRILNEILNFITDGVSRKNLGKIKGLATVKSAAFRATEVKYGIFLIASLLKRRKYRFSWVYLVDTIFSFQKGTLSGIFSGIWHILFQLTKVQKETPNK